MRALGCLLSERLENELRRVGSGKRMTFHEGEERISQWMQENDIEPRQYPEGIEYVIVNGEIVAAKGKHLGTRPGKVLKRIDKLR